MLKSLIKKNLGSDNAKNNIKLFIVFKHNFYKGHL